MMFKIYYKTLLGIIELSTMSRYNEIVMINNM